MSEIILGNWVERLLLVIKFEKYIMLVVVVEEDKVHHLLLLTVCSECRVYSLWLPLIRHN